MYNNNNNIKGRNIYKKTDFESIRIEFSNIDWKTKFNYSDKNINKQWEIMKTKLNLLEEIYIPQKEMSNHR